MNQKIESHFIWIILTFVAWALIYPELFIPFKQYIPLSVSCIMLGIGINMPMSYLSKTLARPTAILGLVLLRYVIMPACAFFITYVFHLTKNETIGLLILGTVPGGVAANVMAYLARANIALTILLTIGSTLISPFVTPALIYLFLHQQVTLQFWDMVYHIAMIVLIPIVLGFLLSYSKNPSINKIKAVMPAVSICFIAFTLACIFSLNQTAILYVSTSVIAAVICLNLCGYLFGGFFAYSLKWEQGGILAAIFDYGMFDGIVAILICTTFFDKETAIPAVLLSITQNITAPVIIRYWKSSKLKRWVSE